MRDASFLPTAEGYDRWSDFYDTEGNPLLDLDEVIVRELLPDPRGLRVLDLGCGTGRHLGRFLDAGARVVGLDFSAGMLTTMHPALFLRDVQAHYVDRDSGREVRFESHPHQVGVFVLAALRAGLTILDIREDTPSRELAATNPRLEKFLGWPMLLALLLKRPRDAA
ncbi:methyltransferase domain-containing protein [Desulfovibrio aminophilus]|uniref:class I SAM-dependent methyltransferase n=1 Tax=Desulfovibrio aminophilus TaxID=81425 RepID=UPI0033952D4F